MFVLQEAMGLSSTLVSHRNYKLYINNYARKVNLGMIKYTLTMHKSGMWLAKCWCQGRVIGLGLDSKQKTKAEAAAAYAAMGTLGFGREIADFIAMSGFQP